ncbi:MAG: UvrD-helicase domain-containing protein [Actinobacteria bacterium]|nr:UvrD-helicase domain-containing protein [Actinomycetota bacterium]
MTSTRFDLTGPLPESSLVIEASAGTGKTFTLAALATRFVAERDVRAAELLIVTFTRAATAELRARVRERIAGAARHLVAVIDGDEPAVPPGTDPLLDHLSSLPVPDRARARDNLARAVGEFDAATISTIHGFAGQVLGLLGQADASEGSLVDDNGELTLAVCADVLAAASASGTPAEHLPKYNELVTRVQTVLSRSDLRLMPEPLGAGPEMDRAVVYLDLVQRGVDEVRAQRRRMGQRSFNDVLDGLRAQLVDDRGGLAANIVRSRFRVALIDEFQDTDPVQWAIFRALFDPAIAAGDGSDPTHLVLVGDPKQAIYAFRGADIHTYLAAVGAQSDTRSLTTNWRSDGAVLDAVDVLFSGVRFGSDEIAFTPVEPSDEHADRRMVDDVGRSLPGLDLRVHTTDHLDTTSKMVCGEPAAQADSARGAVFDDLVRVVRDRLDHAHLPTSDGGTRPVEPSDIAVLVKSAADAEDVRSKLVAQGVPAVLARGTSVLESPAAEQWRWLLDALQRPTDHRRARTFAIGWFGGRDVAWLDRADDRDIAAVQEQLWGWANTLRTHGVEAFLRKVFQESGVVGRVLTHPDGDRSLTDLEHLAELFRTDRAQGRSSVAGLLAVLDRPEDSQVHVNPNAELEGDESSRRVESDAASVQVMTVWVAKGLEFPIVCCPTLWTPPRNGEPLIYPEDGGSRSYDLLTGVTGIMGQKAKAKAWPDTKSAKDRKARADLERDGEALRVLYVALTRASHQTVLWWVRGWQSERSPLGRVLFGAGALDGNAEVPPEAEVVDHLRTLAGAAGLGAEPVLTVTDVGPVPAAAGQWTGPSSVVAEAVLAEATLDRVPPRRTARWSFTSISSRAADTHDNVDRPDVAPPSTVPDEVLDPGELVAALDRPDVSPLAPLPASADFGILVHSIYEHVDFAVDDLEAAVRDQLGRELSWRTFSLVPALLPGATEAVGRDRLVRGVVASLDTPLGADLDDRPLRTFGRADRLDELDFDLRLADGAGRVTDRALGSLLLAHLPDDDPYRGWAERVAAGAYDVDLAGHLTGSIDLVLRVRTPGAPDRFVIADYKTNRLHDPKAPPGADDYAPARLHHEMAHHHYPLQALLYSVALHRYLRWRIADYDPAVHLGGARYLFVRGMAGPGTRGTDGAPHGVARWDVPPALVTAVSDLFAGGSPGASPDAGAAVQGSLFDGSVPSA